jgi:anti-sigma-K factor RskA
MTASSDNEQLQDLSAGYVLGDLTSTEAANFHQLLATSPDLAAEVRSLSSTLDEALACLLAADPPPELRAKLLAAAVETTPQPARPRQKTEPGQTGSPNWLGLLTLSASLVALFITLDSFRLRQELQTAKLQLQSSQQELALKTSKLRKLEAASQAMASAQIIQAMLQRSRTRLFSLKGTNAAQTASANIAVDPSAQQMAMTLHNLPPLPPDHVYRLWAMPETGNKPMLLSEMENIPNGLITGKMSPNPQQDMTMRRLLVTVEPTQAESAPGGPVLMESYP